MKKLKVVFDMGGTLRKINLPNSPDRNYLALRRLYNCLAWNECCEVFVVTKVPVNRTDKEVYNDFDRLNLKRPKEVFILRGIQTKDRIYKEIEPDIVFEDDDECLAMALKINALSLKVV